MSDVELETRNNAVRPTTLADTRGWKANPEEAVLVVEKEGPDGYAMAIGGSVEG